MKPELSFTPDSYAAAREALLVRIRTGLQADRRVVAAWLAGSYGRGEQDAVSDLDLAVIVDPPDAEALCARPTLTGALPVAERLELFGRFGEPANIHENHHNAPSGGSFSSVLYGDPPVIVDWTILPRSLAQRPRATRLLFDRAGIPPLDTDSLEISPFSGPGARPMLSERRAFFWMMAAITAKYMVRGRAEVVRDFLDVLEGIRLEIERLSHQPHVEILKPDDSALETQDARLRNLCGRVAALQLSMETEEESVQLPPLAQIVAILNISMRK